MTSNFPDGMTAADWDHVEGRHLDESHTLAVQVWITYMGERPDQTEHEAVKDITRALAGLDYRPDNVEAEAVWE